ncbi:MAG TPA: DNA mismatch repair protein MutS, partial [Elusimicrobia bacterium]|nr:DNA mismatch repair protein MutS [Elusimicrobiota bacterium]
MKEDLTPLMRQYQKIKQNYKEAILFFRLGDFYEMFGEDAKKASPVLGIALTSRQKVPMCGVPYHTAVNYVAKLIRAGYPVAICEQMEETEKTGGAHLKGIVKREVVRLITPGTILEENLLEAKNNNYLFALYPENKDNRHAYGIVFLDLSTGEFRGTEIKNDSAELAEQKLALELARFMPREGLLPKSEERNTRLVNLLKNKNIRINFYDDWKVDSGLGADYFKEKLKIVSLKGLGIADKKLFLSAGVALLNYLEETQKVIPEYLKEVIISPVNFYFSDEYLALDETAIRNLELLECSATRSKKGSLLEVIDKTLTAMGGRMLRFWLTHPLKDSKSIRERQKIISFFVEENILREQLREEIKKVSDLERLITRLSFNQSNARDLVALKNSLKLIPEIKSIIKQNVKDRLYPENNPGVISGLVQQLSELPEIVDLIDKTIVEEPPIELKEGGIIKKGYSPELDNLMGTRRENKQWISELEKKERERTGINSLKVGYTTVFGYYLEVTKPNLHLVPADYIRKQTLVNAERFITPELKEKETFIFSAEERINRLEYEIYQTVRNEVVKKVKEIQTIAKCLAEMDVYLSLAQVARENNYTQPEVNDSLFIEIKDGRHPVVEKNLLTNQFVPNDTYLDPEENQILIITGPNMAGKSTYIRQVALIVILGQMGSFVPAKEAKIGLVDRIFT